MTLVAQASNFKPEIVIQEIRNAMAASGASFDAAGKEVLKAKARYGRGQIAKELGAYDSDRLAAYRVLTEEKQVEDLLAALEAWVVQKEGRAVVAAAPPPPPPPQVEDTEPPPPQAFPQEPATAPAIPVKRGPGRPPKNHAAVERQPATTTEPSIAVIDGAAILQGVKDILGKMAEMEARFEQLRKENAQLRNAVKEADDKVVFCTAFVASFTNTIYGLPLQNIADARAVLSDVREAMEGKELS